MTVRSDSLDRFMDGLVKRNPGETEFHQAVLEVASSVIPFLHDNPKYQEMQILERRAASASTRRSLSAS